MDFIFAKHEHGNKINVWYNKIFLGQLEAKVSEKPDIDWLKYRADKTLKMEIGERWEVKYIPSVRIAGESTSVLDTFPDKITAARALVDYHKNMAP